MKGDNMGNVFWFDCYNEIINNDEIFVFLYFGVDGLFYVMGSGGL